ncbi:MAG: hypothetical protein JRH16_21855 [Deltaproteobacteria bacterium]|nr:hypothetical protein [Deltaproteobacteria bacterium]
MRLALLPPLIFSLATCSTAWAAEITEFNDSTSNGTSSTPLNAFLAGESTAVWLTASCTGDIAAVEVYWASQFGGAPSQIEFAVSLFSTGTHPTPGAVMINQGGANAVVWAPTLLDGVMNQFRFLDPPANTTAMSVPIVAGQQFVVSLEFINQSSGGAPFAPAPTIDQDGCQPLTNAVDVIPGGWLDACPQGVTGDFVIRAVVDCQASAVPVSNEWSSPVLVAMLAVIGFLAATGGLLGRRGARRPIVDREAARRPARQQAGRRPR